jgi:hypothetical protein
MSRSARGFRRHGADDTRRRRFGAAQRTYRAARPTSKVTAAPSSRFGGRRTAGMARMLHPPSTLATRRPAGRGLTGIDVERLARRCLDQCQALPFRPHVHVEWPQDERTTAPVVDAVLDALTVSLAHLASHEGTTSAFVSVAWRADAIELCVVDDGRTCAHLPGAHLDEATGVEHEVDDYGGVGICQWWSIPLDLA